MQPQNSMLAEKSNNEGTSIMQMSTNLMETEQNKNMKINEMNAPTLETPGGSWMCRKCGKINDPVIKRCKKPCLSWKPSLKRKRSLANGGNKNNVQEMLRAHVITTT